jgi:hypothetical protein
MDRREFLYRSVALALAGGVLRALPGCGGGSEGVPTTPPPPTTVQFETVSFSNTESFRQLILQAIADQKAPADFQTILDATDTLLTPAQKSLATNLFPPGLSEAEIRSRMESFAQSFLVKNAEGVEVFTPTAEFSMDQILQIQAAMLKLPIDGGLPVAGTPLTVDVGTGQVLNPLDKTKPHALATTCLNRTCYDPLAALARQRFDLDSAQAAATGVAAVIAAAGLLAIPFIGTGLYIAAVAAILAIVVIAILQAGNTRDMNLQNAFNSCQEPCPHPQGGVG